MHKTACFLHTFCDGIKKTGKKKKKLLNSTHGYKLDTANLARAPNIALFVHH